MNFSKNFDKMLSDLFGKFYGKQCLRFRDFIIKTGIARCHGKRRQLLRFLECGKGIFAADLQQFSDIVSVWEVNVVENQVGFDVFFRTLLGMVCYQAIWAATGKLSSMFRQA